MNVVTTGMKIGPAGSSGLLDDSNRKREVRLMKNRYVSGEAQHFEGCCGCRNGVHTYAHCDTREHCKPVGKMAVYSYLMNYCFIFSVSSCFIYKLLTILL